MSQLTICLIIFAVTIIGYCSGAYSLATIAITSLMAFTLTGCLTAKDALACFSNGNVIMIARLPLLIITMLYCIFVAVRLAPDEPSAELSVMGKKKAGAAPLNTFQEAAGIIIFFADAVGMMFASKAGLALWQVTVIGALAMVLCGVLKPKEASGAIPLSMLLLIVGALGISSALSTTGAGEMIGGHISSLVSAVGGNSYLIGMIFFVVPFMISSSCQIAAP